MITALGLASLLIFGFSTWAASETRMAEQNGLPRNYDRKWLPWFRNGYLAGMMVGALGAGLAFGLVK